MDYDQQAFEQAVEQFGEVFFVLDSDREYIVHGKEGYDLLDDRDGVRVEGMQDDEYVVAVFGFDEIEHHYTHKEV